MSIVKFVKLIYLFVLFFIIISTFIPVIESAGRESRAGQKLIRFGRAGQKLIRFGRSLNPPPPADIANEEGIVYDEHDPDFHFNDYNAFKRGGQKLIRFGKK
uniref:Uncharacterized protein n=1 Tax=Strongyloides stercoralis TaxID=6248 RepID=A0A0K0DUF4_STRER